MNFDPPIPVLVIAVLSVLAMALAVRREIVRRRSLKPGWLHPLCLVLRLAALFALTLILLNPSRQLSSNEDSSAPTMILIDASASMTLASEADGSSRWDEAVVFAKAVTKEINEAELSAFAAGFTPIIDLNQKPDGRATNLAAALQRILTTTAPVQIIVLSDGGIHDRAELGRALGLANAARVPVSTKVFGVDRPPRNLAVKAVQSPRMVRPRSPVSIHVDVEGTGITDDEILRLELTDEAGETIAESEFYLDSEGEAGQSLVFESGLRTGHYQLKLLTENRKEHEVDLGDNEFSFRVEIATGKLRVLFVEGTHWKRAVGDKGHFWNDMELMTRAWEATGEIEQFCLSPLDAYTNQENLGAVTFHNGEMLFDFSKGFPPTREEMYSYDVMLISDVPVGNFSNEQMQWVVDWVEKRGGGFLMGGGHTTFDSGNYDKTPWEKIVPVDMKAYGEGFSAKWFKIDIPEEVRDHTLWQVSPDPKQNDVILSAHPRFAGMNHVRRAKPGAIVLAVRSGTNEPVIAAQQYGRGRSVAFLPDPNGGWGRFYADWGPADGPTLNPNWVHLGQGKKFRFDEAAANRDVGPSPPHPSAWYGQYWVNVVRWLGENSIRWQRDKLAGRVISAQAHPGENLPVAAEIIPVTEIDELLSLDVGARLESGGRRIRLNYDRDRREFTGELSVPEDLESKTELNVIFDANVRGQDFSESISVGIHRGNPEFSQSKPDPVFMGDLATATGGSILKTVSDAAEFSHEATERRRLESKRSWSEPLWASTWPLAIFGLCLSLEWALRRHGETVAADYEREVYA